MDLFLCDMTFREIAGEESPFPESLRRMILQSVQRVPIEDMEQLLERHEADIIVGLACAALTGFGDQPFR